MSLGFHEFINALHCFLLNKSIYFGLYAIFISLLISIVGFWSFVLLHCLFILGFGILFLHGCDSSGPLGQHVEMDIYWFTRSFSYIGQDLRRVVFVDELVSFITCILFAWRRSFMYSIGMLPVSFSKLLNCCRDCLDDYALEFAYVIFVGRSGSANI